jgi:hypothetical protein
MSDVVAVAGAAQAVSHFDWNQFLNVALPTLFTTGLSIATLIWGQRSGKKVGATAADHANTTLQVALQALNAAQTIVQAVQDAKKPDGAGAIVDAKIPE